jgi:hypothetical protein
VVDETTSGVGERNAVGDVMVCRAFVCCIAAAELESVAVTLEICEAPSEDVSIKLEESNVAKYLLKPLPHEIVS